LPILSNYNIWPLVVIILVGIGYSFIGLLVVINDYFIGAINDYFIEVINDYFIGAINDYFVEAINGYFIGGY
jgi:hypothetical protein